VISKYFGLTDFIEKLQVAKNLTDEEKASFQSWKPMNINLEHQKFLTKEGEEELFSLGSRFRNRFSELVSDKHASFTFKHTPTQRTNLSARRFIAGLFNNEAIDYEVEEVARDDVVLRPYKGCHLWRKNVKKNPNTLIEKRKLVESEHVANIVKEIREMTQIDYLDFKDIELIYTMCGFETAWRHRLHDGKSVWCSLFKNEAHIKTMEYLEDMEYYWIDGPGFEITKRVACKTVADMLELLDPASQNDQKLTFYFTHSGTILKLLTFLELYQDDFQLTADKLNRDRKWQTSLIDTFSSNIVAILYQ
jgi:multiple inositol-polyphosphate phosphatase/2,3-bisphosphoglycerate 3-phosphatase